MQELLFTRVQQVIRKRDSKLSERVARPDQSKIDQKSELPDEWFD
jgi:hypothetical protein